MQCTYIKEDQTQCQARAMKKEQFCFAHHPDKRKEHELAVKKGGLASRRDKIDLEPINLRTPQDAVLLLEEVMNLVRTGELAPNIGNTMAYICSHALKAMEAAELDERLEVVESILLERKTIKKGGRR